MLASSRHLWPFYMHADGTWSPEPKNVEDILKTMKTTRRCLSPSVVPETAHEDFQQQTADTVRRKFCHTVMSFITDDLKIWYEVGVTFTNLTSITGNATLIPRPDLFDGAHPDTLDKKV